MNRITCIILLLLSLNVNGQNLVPNGNFESYTSCPGTFSQITNCTGWSQYIQSCDYFNACVGTGTHSVPTNYNGSQAAASGNAYGGFGVLPFSIDREALGKTITPLSIGSAYEVSMSVSLADNSMYGLNCLGVHFIQNAPTTGTHSSASTTIPKVSFSSYGTISNKTGWTRLSCVFNADSAYNFIAISGWGAHTSYLVDTTTGTVAWAYYYVDSVVIKLANGINNLYADSMICAGDTFQVPYSVNNLNNFNTGNVFSVQLSNPSGSFASGTSIIGTHTATTGGSITCVVPNTVTPSNNYRIRIRSTNIPDSSGYSSRDISIGITRLNVSNSNNGPICVGQPLNLTASITTTGVGYKWTGPNNFTSTLQNPTIAPAPAAANGNYIVTARLFGCIAKDTTTATVVNVLASVSTSATTPICERDTLRLNATVVGTPNSYSWAGPNNFTSSAKDASIINAQLVASGDYIISVNYPGCTVKDTVSVLVKPLASGRNISSNSPICSGDTLRLNASSSSTGVNYTWTGPNSFISTVQNTYISNAAANASGNYIMNYVLNGCAVIDTVVVTVHQSPIPINISANTPVCERDTLFLTSTNSTTGVTWQWSGPNSFTASVQNPVLANSSLAANGNYIATATNSFGCTAKDTVSVLVKPLPANFNATTNAPICEGSTLQVNGNTSTTGVSFVWTGPNSFSSTLQNAGITNCPPVATGNYIVTGTLNGCSIKDTVFAQVTAIPAAPVPSANTPVCVGQNLNLNASTVAGATYQWTGVGGYTSSTQNPTRINATTAMAGKYYVTATINNCVSLADSITVIVNPAPVINMYPSPKDSICVGATVNFISSIANAGSSPQYKWYKNNNLIPGAISSMYNTSTASDYDEYFATVTAMGVCANLFTDSSNKIQMRVFPYLAPSVSITANPNTTVASGTMINFTATPVNAGNFPKYQWTRNGTNVVGALSNLWGANSLSNGDVICTEITSNYLCPNPTKAKSNCIKVSIETTGISGTSISNQQPAIYPNPTKDKLIIEGITKGTRIQLNDVLGRTLQTQTAANETETLNLQALIPGNYILQLSYTNGDRMTVKVVKE